MYYASTADVIAVSRTPGGNTNASITAANKADLLRYIRIVSRRIDLDFAARRPLFLPYTEARKFLVTSERINSSLNTFRLDGPLLELTALSVAGTALTPGTTVTLYPDPDMPPFNEVRLTDYSTWYGYCAADNAPAFVTATGVWGLHRDYANAWLTVDALAADITASVASLTVADADGLDDYGFTPRLSEGQILRIDSEYLIVLTVNTGTNVLTVKRGQLGSTAAAHAQSDAVEIFQVEEPIKFVVARQAAFIWARQGAYTTMQSDGISEVRYPPDLLAELRAVESDYANGY